MELHLALCIISMMSRWFFVLIGCQATKISSSIQHSTSVIDVFRALHEVTEVSMSHCLLFDFEMVLMMYIVCAYMYVCIDVRMCVVVVSFMIVNFTRIAAHFNVIRLDQIWCLVFDSIPSVGIWCGHDSSGNVLRGPKSYVVTHSTSILLTSCATLPTIMSTPSNWSLRKRYVCAIVMLERLYLLGRLFIACLFVVCFV